MTWRKGLGAILVAGLVIGASVTVAHYVPKYQALFKAVRSAFAEGVERSSPVPGSPTEAPDSGTLLATTTTVTAPPKDDGSLSPEPWMGWVKSYVPHAELPLSDFGSGAVNAFAVLGDRIVAAGSDLHRAQVWISADAGSWVSVSIPPESEASRIDALIVWGGQLVAAGSARHAGTSGAEFWLSTDAEVWHRATDVDRDASRWETASDVSWIGRDLVAVGSTSVLSQHGLSDMDAAVWTSPDGSTWSRVPDQESLSGSGYQRMAAVVNWNGQLIAVGVDDGLAAVWTSSDGRHWGRIRDIQGDPLARNQLMADVTVWHDRLIAVGGAWFDDYPSSGDGAVWTSLDGGRWTRVGAGNESVFGGAGLQIMTAVAGSDSGLVIVGSESGLQTGMPAEWGSTDGYHWERAPSDPSVLIGKRTSQLVSVAAWKRGYVGGGSEGMFLHLDLSSNSYSEGATLAPAVWKTTNIPSDKPCGTLGATMAQCE
jgi:hypothetical protein